RSRPGLCGSDRVPDCRLAAAPTYDRAPPGAVRSHLFRIAWPGCTYRAAARGWLPAATITRRHGRAPRHSPLQPLPSTPGFGRSTMPLLPDRPDHDTAARAVVHGGSGFEDSFQPPQRRVVADQPERRAEMAAPHDEQVF